MTSLLVSLGGDAYPSAPALRHAAFAPSSRALSEILVSGDAALLPPENHLDLFDDPHAWPEQLIAIRDWVRAKMAAAEGDASDRIDNILVHYVGHGIFKPNSEAHYLTINATDAEDRPMTSASLGQLNDILVKNVQKQRRIYLIDACFAAASIRDLMGVPEDAIEVHVGGILGAWPEGDWGESGVAALCSADRTATASAGGERDLTQFTDGLLSVLETGDKQSEAPLSLRRIHRLLRDTLTNRYGTEAVHPVLVAPEDRDGGIAAAPIFPNAHKRKGPEWLMRVFAAVGKGRQHDPAEETVEGNADRSELEALDSAGTDLLVQAAAPGSHRPIDQGMTPDARGVGQTDWGVAVGTLADGTEANLLSAEQRFRQAAYRFFRLPHSKKDEIARTLDPAGDAGSTLPDLERYKAVLANARAKGVVDRLEKMIGRAESGQ